MSWARTAAFSLVALACSPNGGSPNGGSPSADAGQAGVASGGRAGAGGITGSGASGPSGGSSAQGGNPNAGAGAIGNDAGGGGAGASGMVGSAGSGGSSPGAFVHPGLLLQRADLERLRERVSVGEEPYLAGWNRLRNEARASIDYTPTPFVVVTRNSGGTGEGNAELRDDATRAFFHAVQWFVAEDEAHAQKSAEILNAWSFDAHRDRRRRGPLPRRGPLRLFARQRGRDPTPHLRRVE